MSMNDDIKTVLVSEEQLKAKVAELGARISKDYEGKNLVLVSILKGSVVFMADLMRAVTIPCNIDFMVFPADFEEKIQVVHKKDLKNQADYARITTLYAGLVLRTRQPGDVYRPAGRSVHNRLRKWMNETGIPASQRDQLPLLAAGSEVLWVCGAGFAEGLAPDADTAQVLQMEMEHREEIT